jgi:hypothetical protein
VKIGEEGFKEIKEELDKKMLEVCEGRNPPFQALLLVRSGSLYLLQ